MCQCLCCDCWWINYCGIVCAGWHYAICICSYWLCKPDDLANIDPNCCHICDCDGYGGNQCCCGSICCAPDTVKTWSKMRSGGGTTQVVVITDRSNGY
jgi:hypothetical protein